MGRGCVVAGSLVVDDDGWVVVLCRMVTDNLVGGLV